MDEWLDQILAKIEAHATYGPAMRQAAAEGKPIVMNYHTHGPGHGYCLSLLAKSSLVVLGQKPSLKELVHIRGVGATEAEGVPFMTAVGEKLRARYALASLPEMTIDGKPVAG